MKPVMLPLKFPQNPALNAVHLLKEMVAVCIWFVLVLAVVLNGVGFAKLNGLEIVWGLIGSVNNRFVFVVIF